MKANAWKSLVAVLTFASFAATAQTAAPASDLVQPQIIGGQGVANGKYPFMVTVQLKGFGGNNAYDKHWCGASLISPWLVLTAAHCAVGFESGQLSVIAGRTVLTNERQGVAADVESIYVHPKYAQDGAYDVAVLVLKSPITKVKPVELATRGTDALERPGRLLVNTGWGNTIQQNPFPPGGSGVSNPNRLQEVELPVVSHTECQLSYGNLTEDLDLCAGRTGKDACQGDSGGPLFVAVPNTNRFIQVGTVSRGEGCGASGYPGVFTRLANPEISDFIAAPWSGTKLVPKRASR